MRKKYCINPKEVPLRGIRALVVVVLGTNIVNAMGCALMLHGETDQIQIQSQSSDAELYLDGAQIGKGTATPTVRRGQKYIITAKKNGCSDSAPIQTGSKFDEVSLLGILIDFGLISILLVDNLSGALWKTEPAVYSVSPICP
jgi:hypothetical protein